MEGDHQRTLKKFRNVSSKTEVENQNCLPKKRCCVQVPYKKFLLYLSHLIFGFFRVFLGCAEIQVFVSFHTAGWFFSPDMTFFMGPVRSPCGSTTKNDFNHAILIHKVYVIMDIQVVFIYIFFPWFFGWVGHSAQVS